MATMYVRYKLVQAFNDHDRKLRFFNRLALVFGTASALGVSLVANFQVVWPCHLIHNLPLLSLLLFLLFFLFSLSLAVSLSPIYAILPPFSSSSLSPLLSPSHPYFSLFSLFPPHPTFFLPLSPPPLSLSISLVPII